MTVPATTFLPDPRPDLRALEDQITELAAHIHAATYRLLVLIREFDERHGWAGPGMRSCAHWLNWKIGLNLGAAREKVRVAHALKELPRISEAFREGRVSYSKVRAMTRVATADNEDYLLMIARHGTTAHVERLVRQYRKVKRIEALAQENARHQSRELSWFEDDDGSWVFRGRFTPGQAAVIRKALELALDEAFDERKDVSAETSDEDEPIAARRADALERIADGYLGGDKARSGGDRYLVHVHADRDTLSADGAGAEAEVEGCGCVSAETSRRMACDAAVVHWQENGQGEALNIGRKTRTIPPAIRRGLQRRDGGCRFPGCTCTRFVDAHHIKHWVDGGETNLENLVLLCRHHHRLVHEGRFGVHAAEGQIGFTDPQGKSIPQAPEQVPPGEPDAIADANVECGLQITPRTIVPLWHGERMWNSLAVDGLLQRE